MTHKKVTLAKVTAKNDPPESTRGSFLLEGLKANGVQSVIGCFQQSYIGASNPLKRAINYKAASKLFC